MNRFLHFHFVTNDKVHGNANHEECQAKVPIKSLFMVRFNFFYKSYRKLEMCLIL